MVWIMWLNVSIWEENGLKNTRGYTIRGKGINFVGGKIKQT